MFRYLLNAHTKQFLRTLATTVLNINPDLTLKFLKVFKKTLRPVRTAGDKTKAQKNGDREREKKSGGKVECNG